MALILLIIFQCLAMVPAIQYFVMSGIDCAFGQNLASYDSVASSAACATNCNGNVACIGYAYQTITKSCWLKSTLTSCYESVPQLVTGIQQTMYDSNFNTIANFDCWNVDLTTTQSGSVQSAETACLAMPNCVGFTYYTASQTYWLKGTLNTAVYSGYINCGSSTGKTLYMRSTLFTYTGADQTYTVPAGVSSIVLYVAGASGGMTSNTATAIPGYGGFVTATCKVTPGSVLKIVIGNNGGSPTGGDSSGYDLVGGNAGSIDGTGGGGGTFVGVCPSATSCPSMSNLVIAGGGGGADCSLGACYSGGNGGKTGSSGTGHCTNSGGGGGAFGSGGGGGSSCSGGQYGTSVGAAGSGYNGGNGDGGTGGQTKYGGGGGGGSNGGGGGAFGSGGGGGSFAYNDCSGIAVTYGTALYSGSGIVIITTPTPVPTPLPTFAPIPASSSGSTWVTSDLSQSCTSACTAKGPSGSTCYLPDMLAINTLAKIQALGCTGNVAWDAGAPTGNADGWGGNVPFIAYQAPGVSNPNCYFVSPSYPAAGQSTCDASQIYRYRLCACHVPDKVIAVAGTGGTWGSSGDGGPATSALLDHPGGIDVDVNGNLYIADLGNNRIRLVKNGIISTIAGTGVAGYNGDGLTATSARLNSPINVAFDNNLDCLYIADNSNNRIRLVKAYGAYIISTFAGTGVAGYNGDGGSATSALLDHPSGIVFDSNSNLYIADSGNYRIRFVSKSTGIISTIAGTGVQGNGGSGGFATSTQLYAPGDMAFDFLKGILYITEAPYSKIRIVTTSTGIMTTLACTNGQLNYPGFIALDSNDNLYISDYNINKVFVTSKVSDVTSCTTSTFAGSGATGNSGNNGAATSATFYNPEGVVIDPMRNGYVYISDYGNAAIRLVILQSAPTYAPSYPPTYAPVAVPVVVPVAVPVAAPTGSVSGCVDPTPQSCGLSCVPYTDVCCTYAGYSANFPVGSSCCGGSPPIVSACLNGLKCTNAATQSCSRAPAPSPASSPSTCGPVCCQGQSFPAGYSCCGGDDVIAFVCASGYFCSNPNTSTCSSTGGLVGGIIFSVVLLCCGIFYRTYRRSNATGNAAVVATDNNGTTVAAHAAIGGGPSPIPTIVATVVDVSPQLVDPAAAKAQGAAKGKEKKKNAPTPSAPPIALGQRLPPIAATAGSPLPSNEAVFDVHHGSSSGVQMTQTQPAAQRYLATAGGGQFLAAPPPQAAPPTSLPPGWIVQADPGSGAPFFVYTPTGHTQWNPPV